MNSPDPMKDQSPTSPTADELTDPEALIAAGQRYFATAFPNPERAGCPLPAALHELIAAEQVPDAALRAHLFHCSECFNQYRVLVVERRGQAAPHRRANTVAPWAQLMTALRSWRIPAVVGATALLLLAAGIFISRPQPSAPHLGQSSPQPTLTARTDAPASPAPPAPEQRAEASPLLARRIDLNDYTALATVGRGANEPPARSVIKLPRAHLQLDLTLPMGSAPGRYQVSLVDAFYQPRAQGQARSRDGQRLHVALDLRPLRGSHYTLRLTRAQAAPDDYPVVIVPR